MDPHDLRPQEVATLVRVGIESRPEQVATFTRPEFPAAGSPETIINHAEWFLPRVPISGPVPARTPALPAFVPDVRGSRAVPSGALPVPLPPLGDPSPLRLRDTGPVVARSALIEGLPPRSLVYQQGRIVAVTAPDRPLYLPPGRVVVAHQNGTVIARAELVRGRRYLYGTEAQLRAMEPFAFEGPGGAMQFELNRASQAPGEYITIERLKNSSWAHAGGRWVQADDNGRVQIGPLPNRTYAVTVTDRDGEAYAYFQDAVPGDRLLGAYNFSSGYGYYGWLSGKGFEVKKAFIEAVDEIVAGTTGQIYRLRQILVNDGVSTSDAPLGRKGPGRQVDLSILADLATLAPVKMTVYDGASALDRLWVHLRAFGPDTVTVDAQASVFNTRITVYELVQVTDRNNRPASWAVLDLMTADAQGTLGRARQTVYDQLSVDDAGMTTYRRFIKGDGLRLEELGSFKNLSRFGYDTLTLAEYRVQSLLALIGYDAVNLTDTATGRPMSLRVRESLLLTEQLVELRNLSLWVSEHVLLSDHTPSRFPLLTVGLEPVQVMDTTRLGVLSGRVPVVPDASVRVYSGQRTALDAWAVLDLHVPELARPDAEASQVTERAFLTRSTLRRDELSFTERAIRWREIRGEESFTLSERGEFPRSVLFSPSGMTLTRLAPYQFRPELHRTEDSLGQGHAAYLRSGGGLYHAQTDGSGTWGSARLVTATPEAARSVSVTTFPGADGEDVCVAWSQPEGAGSRLTVLRGGEPFWTALVPVPNADIQIASTSRYAGADGELLIGYQSAPTVLTVRSALHGTERHYPQSERIRIDQTVTAHGNVTWVLGLPDSQSRRSLFVTHPTLRVRRVDQLHVRTGGPGVRLRRSVQYLSVADRLDTGHGRAGASINRAGQSPDLYEAVTLRAQPQGLRLIRGTAPVRTGETLDVRTAPRQVRLVRATVSAAPREQLTPATALLGVRLTQVSVGTEQTEQLTTHTHLTGVRYDRK